MGGDGAEEDSLRDKWCAIHNLKYQDVFLNQGCINVNTCGIPQTDGK